MPTVICWHPYVSSWFDSHSNPAASSETVGWCLRRTDTECTSLGDPSRVVCEGLVRWTGLRQAVLLLDLEQPEFLEVLLGEIFLQLSGLVQPPSGTAQRGEATHRVAKPRGVRAVLVSEDGQRVRVEVEPGGVTLSLGFLQVD